MDDENLSRRERKKQLNRRQIIDAALDLFQAQSVEATTIDAIAEAADVSRGTFYNYFPTKEALLSAIAAEEVRTLEARLDDNADHDPVARIYDLMRALMTDTLAFLQVTRYILLQAMLHPSNATSPSVQLDAILTPLVDQAQAQGKIRADLDSTAVAGALVDVCLGAFYRLIADDVAVDRATLARVEATIEMLFQGIAEPGCG